MSESSSSCKDDHLQGCRDRKGKRLVNAEVGRKAADISRIWPGGSRIVKEKEPLLYWRWNASCHAVLVASWKPRLLLLFCQPLHSTAARLADLCNPTDDHPHMLNLMIHTKESAFTYSYFKHYYRSHSDGAPPLLLFMCIRPSQDLIQGNSSHQHLITFFFLGTP